MEYMPTTTKNLTISPFGKFHVKTPIQTLKQLQRKFGHNKYNDLHIQTKFPLTSLELHLGLLLKSPITQLQSTKISKRQHISKKQHIWQKIYIGKKNKTIKVHIDNMYAPPKYMPSNKIFQPILQAIQFKKTKYNKT